MTTAILHFKITFKSWMKIRVLKVVGGQLVASSQKIPVDRVVQYVRVILYVIFK